MYTPPAYVESNLALLHDRMRQWSFATLVTHGANGLNATHLPFLLEPHAGDKGTLIAHLARANAQYQDLLAGARTLVVFQGPHAFISPSWYRNRLTFPTWNYTAIHAHGHPVLVEEPEAVHDILRATVATYDTPLGGEWSFPEMPQSLTQSRLRAIVGVRIPLDAIEGKMKLNQDKSVADRRGVIAALERQGGEQALAVARMIGEQPDMSDAAKG
ncbi:MAG TPA: FMN-binding negative transcriptional regulator [Burkholderiaceae bacterium]|nr:FMN-binding negative transcriptional regulator [Burkholderiaceae bacterium]